MTNTKANKKAYIKRLSSILLITIALSWICPTQQILSSQGETTRRVNIPYFDATISWAEAGIFWFGQVDPPGTSGRNYADVRVAYTAEELVIYFNIVDYYFWYDLDGTSGYPLTDFDAVAVYLDTNHDQALTPQEDDYVFVSGLCLYQCGDGSRYNAQGQGNGTTWDMGGSIEWSDNVWASWNGNPPHNNNSNTFDYGWWSYIHLPWETLNMTGPPSSGTTWGLGAVLYDRDNLPPNGSVSPQIWPENLNPDQPATWAEASFGMPQIMEPHASDIEGITVIRRGLTDSIVEDSWAGGGGNCTGGHEGDPENDNYGDSQNLFVENQELIADFPCFSKSFLRFHLDPIPEGKTIVSATLSLYHWSNARWDLAQPSLIWLLTIDGDWEESTITWNNAPLAQENQSTTWVQVITPDNNPGLPGIRYDWEATKAVSEAYASGKPVNIAMYTADTNFHSSKYLLSSEAEEWVMQGRPTLTIAWGQDVVFTKNHELSPGETEVNYGSTITYTLALIGSNQAITVTDSVPEEVSHPLNYTETSGSTTYDLATRTLTWLGNPTDGEMITITYPVTVSELGTHTIVNTAHLTMASGTTSTASNTILAAPQRVFLPCILKWS